MARQQLYSDGGIDQVHIERRRGDRHGLVATEHFWTISLSVPHARWHLNDSDSSTEEVDRHGTAAQLGDRIAVPGAKNASGTGRTMKLRSRCNWLKKRRTQCSVRS